MTVFSDDLYLHEKRFSCKRTLFEFHVRTEDELVNKLVKESKKIPCIICKREYPAEELDFTSGDPICKHCNL